MSVAQRLRQKLLDLAIHGKLVSQCAKDEPAGELLARIRKARSAGGGRPRTSDALLPIPEEEMPFDLPRGWVWCRLTDIAEIQLGKMLDAEKNKGKPFRYLANVSVRWGSFDVDNLKTTRFTDDEIEKFALKQGDLLVCEGGVPGRCAVWRECDSEIKYQKALHRIRPCEVLPDYLQMYFEAIYQRPFFTERFTGSTIHHLPREVLMSVPVPLPPLAEQKRIVEKLNVMLKEATRVAESTERLAQLRKKARVKILDLAIRGKLVKQEKTDEPATELLKRIAAEKAKLVAEKKIKKEKPLPPIAEEEIPFDLPKGWAWARLADLTDSRLLNDGDWILADDMVADGPVRLLQLGSVGDGKYRNKGFKFLTKERCDELGCTEIHEGYLLINRMIGDKMLACLMPHLEGRVITAVDVCWISPSERYDVEYLMYSVLAPYFQRTVMDLGAGEGRVRISKGNLVKIPFPLPPLAEQHRIVAKVKEMLAACDAFGGEG